MTSEDAIRNEAYLSVYHLLDDVCFLGRLPAGATGRIHKVIDCLRRIDAPTNDIRVAEQMSVAMLRLEAAVRNGDSPEQERFRHELQTLGARWLQTPMRLTLN